ncbi:MAG TPA: hypothetical protein VLD63_14095 [Anaerolineales bacterium]|nr:hypothetical protein [Anaerolineales bacterium]
MGVDEDLGYAPRRLFNSPSENFSCQFTVAKAQGHRFLITKCLGIAAACLAAGLMTFIATEAFDSDLDIAQHRARSTLSADSPFLSIPLDMAEPRELVLNAAPSLGHFSYRGSGEVWNVTGTAKRTRVGSPSRALPLASRISL